MHLEFGLLFGEYGCGQYGGSCERSSLPSKDFRCISMYKLQTGALMLVGRLVEAITQLWGMEKVVQVIRHFAPNDLCKKKARN